MFFIQSELDNQTRSQGPTREVDEWMLICQHGWDLQPSSIDPNSDVDWTSSSHLYSNLNEIPSFISTHRQSVLQVSYTPTVNPNLLQGKQLLV